jgi:GTP-binding protein
MSGTLKVGTTVGYTKPDQPVKTGKIAELFVFNNLGRTSVTEVRAGEICMVTGLEGISIGDTVRST